MTDVSHSGRIGLALELAVAACLFPLAGWLFWAFVLRLGPNDFHDYWLAGRLLLDGKSPYDMDAMAALAAREHLSFSLGGGYSYPLPFALVMVPFAALPFDVAAAAFGAVSLGAFGAGVAGWLLVAVPSAHGRRLLAAAFVAGLYPPVYGSLAMGQANLLLLPILAAGTWLAVPRAGGHAAERAGGDARGLAPSAGARTGPALGGAFVGLTAVVKLVPGALLIPLALARRRSAAAGLVLAVVAAMALAAIAVPWAFAGSGGLASNLDPDAFYTNQSINGFVSRLVLDTPKSHAIVPGAFDAGLVMALLTALFGLATLFVLWRGRETIASAPAGLATGLAFSLVAATIGAPKTSFWNESFLLVAVAAVLAFEAPDLRLSRLPVPDRRALGVWFGSAVVWAVVWAVEPPATGPLSAVVNLAWSASLVGMLGLWWMLGRRLLAPPPASGGASATGVRVHRL